MNNFIQNRDDDVISVSQLNKMAKNVLENHLPIYWIKGEVSGLKTYAHIYFDLKDEGAKISCVMFAKLAALVDFPLENGTKIEVRGRVTIYPQNGSYQINVERVRKVGLGELWEAYHRLINKLRAEGLFESKYKKSLPIFPRAIGVITSKEGSVIRDVLTTLKRRMPNIPIVIYHSAVQGTDAAMQIAKAIRIANQRKDVDVLIVCRGGGSMEDLWCFNEEIVAREVFSSELPIISAVGHETDTTIIDFVADLRAPTPTAAAELVTKSAQEWQDVVYRLQFDLQRKFDYILNSNQQRLDLLTAELKAINPLNKLIQQQQHLTQLEHKLAMVFKYRLENANWKLESLRNILQKLYPSADLQQEKLLSLSARLDKVIKQYLVSKSQQLVFLANSLTLLNPDSILARGYAIVHDANGKVIQTIKHAKQHAKIQVSLADGSFSAIVDHSLNPEQQELL